MVVLPFSHKIRIFSPLGEKRKEKEIILTLVSNELFQHTDTALSLFALLYSIVNLSHLKLHSSLLLNSAEFCIS
jgi:hypothetical protein